MTTPSTKIPEPEFDWIQLKKDIGNGPIEETQKEKLLRKINENPLVPIGCLATFAALSFGLWSMKGGNSRMSQLMMRARIAAQGFTVFALIAGVAAAVAKK